MEKHVVKPLIAAEEVEKRIRELAEQINADYAGRTVHLVGILKGSVPFLCSLARHLTVPVTMDFMSCSSYGSGTVSKGIVKLVKDLDEPVEGRDVLLIEDIIDSGCTLSFLKRVLEQRNPASIKVCTILDKPSRRKVDFKGEYVGFEIPDEFVVGYGLDYDGKYRNLKDVCVLELTEE